MRKEDCWYKAVCTYDSCVNCIRYSEMKYLIDNSGIPKNRRKPQSLEAGIDYNQFVILSSVKEKIKELVENDDDFNLYICSRETGNGKTSWSIKILLKYFDQVWAGNGFRVRGYFQHVPTLFNELKNFEKNHDALKDVLKNADIVVWDDIASTKLSDFDIQQLLIILDQRIVDGKTNIYTGNLTSYEAVEKALGSRLASRIWNCSTVVELKGKDRRNGSIADTFKNFSN